MSSPIVPRGIPSAPPSPSPTSFRAGNGASSRAATGGAHGVLSGLTPPANLPPRPRSCAVESGPRLPTCDFQPLFCKFRNTVTLDLRLSEADLLARMKQKTRYNVRLAEKKGVHVRPGSPADLDLLYRLYAETSVRDGFVIRSADYYREAWGSFIEAGLARPFIAEVEGEPVSALILFRFARTAWYMYGMSREAHREKMPNHLLQWA